MRIVKVFVSSLFTEMMVERDYLHRQVTALLGEKLAEFTVQFIDLRWGIDSRSIESGTALSGYVLKKCFEAIDECDLFLGVLASGYGSIVDSDIGNNFFPNETVCDESYTSLEIRYARKNISPERMFFIMTEPSGEDEPKAAALKKQVAQQYAVKYYQKESINGKECLSDSYVNGIVAMVCEAVGKIHDDIKPVRTSHWFQREGVIDNCVDSLGKSTIVLLHGASGCGKSVLLNTVNDRIREGPYRIFTAQDFSSNATSVLNENLKNWCGTGETLEKMLQLFQQQILQSDLPSVIFLDSIDEMDINEFYVLYSKISQLPPEKVTMFLSVSRADKLQYLSELEIKKFNVELLEQKELIPFIKHIAAQAHKKIFEEVCNFITSQGDKVRNALYLTTLVDMLMTMTSEDYALAQKEPKYLEALIRRMIEIVENAPNDTEQVILWKLQDMDKHINSDYSRFMFELMSVYNLPIPLALAKEIFEDIRKTRWSDLEYYMYRYYMKEGLREAEGKISFSHDIVRHCVQKIYHDIDEDVYITGIIRALQKTRIDDPMLYFFSGRSQPEVFLQELQENSCSDSMRRALDLLLNWYLPLINEDTDIPLVQLFYRIRETCGLQKLMEILLELIPTRVISFYTERGAMFCLQILKIVDQPETDRVMLMKLLRQLIVQMHNCGCLQHSVPIIGCLFKLLFTEKMLGELLVLVPEEVEDTIYYSYQALISLDQFPLAGRLLELSVELAKNGRSIKIYYPSIVQSLQKKSLKDASDLCECLLHRHQKPDASQEKSAYGNLLYAHMSNLMLLGKTDALESVIDELYHIFYEQYMEDNLSEHFAYDYSLGLSAMLVSPKVNKNPAQKKQLYRELINLRIHLCKQLPNQINTLQCLANTIIQVFLNDEDVGIEHEQLLQTLYSFIESLAKRGNPQACWMISSTLQATRGNEKVFKFFMKMLNGIEEFLEPIMRLNHKNVGMVNELIHTYLSIYKQYCDLRILPFATGHHLLQQLYHFGKNEFVTSGAELSMAKSLIKVFLEMITIVINSAEESGGLMGVMEHADYTDFCQFAREQYEQQPCSATRLLMSTPDLVELLMYLSLISHTKKLGSDGVGLLKMILSHINLSMGNVILKTVGKILLTVQELHKSGVTVPDEFVLLPYSMLEVLPMVFSEPRVKVYSKIYRRKLIGYMKPEVQKVIRNQ